MRKGIVSILIVSILVLSAGTVFAADRNLSIGQSWWTFRDTGYERGWISTLDFRYNYFFASVFYGETKWNDGNSANQLEIGPGFSVGLRFDSDHIFIAPEYSEFHRGVGSFTYEDFFVKVGGKATVGPLYFEAGVIVPIWSRVREYLYFEGTPINQHVYFYPESRFGWFAKVESTGRFFVRLSFDQHNFGNSPMIHDPLDLKLNSFQIEATTFSVGFRF